jgi:hypothetical protein
METNLGSQVCDRKQVVSETWTLAWHDPAGAGYASPLFGVFQTNCCLFDPPM